MSHISSGILVSLDFNEREEFSWLFLITNNKKRTCIQESVINESCSSRISHKRILVCLVVFLHNSPIPFIPFKLLTKSVNSEVSIFTLKPEFRSILLKYFPFLYFCAWYPLQHLQDSLCSKKARWRIMEVLPRWYSNNMMIPWVVEITS
jgi:hypothetical protein